jgi:hypothetical protein
VRRGFLALCGRIFMLKLETGVDDGLVREFRVVIRIRRMSDVNILDHGTRISAGKDQTNLLDRTVIHLLGTLDELVGPDRHMPDVSVLNKSGGILTLLGGLVQEPIAIDSLGPIFKKHVTQNIVRGVVLV